jgi:MOSC domain-containing protein YiiM
VAGIDWARVVPGVELRVGGVRLAITKFASPCYKIAGSFVDGNYARISEKTHTGWSRVCARVIEGGIVRIGDAVTLG